jgi:chromosome partitioning protein
MQVIAVLNQKGGVGKTTIATNLAAAAHLAGHQTVLFDLDAQSSSMDWFNARTEDSQLATLRTVKVAKPLRPHKFREQANLVGGCDLAILDCPAGLGRLNDAAALAADTYLIPVRPGSPDVWAVDETLACLDQADEDRGTPARRLFVINQAITGTTLARDAPDVIGEFGTLLSTVLHMRVAYTEAFNEGESVLTYAPGSAAADEIHALFKQVTQRKPTRARRRRSA